MTTKTGGGDALSNHPAGVSWSAASQLDGVMVMPLVRYFLWVGGVLLALISIADAYFPKLPAAETAGTDLPVIRIQSDRKWPDRVVYDTNLPPVVPAQIANASLSSR